MGLDIEAWHQRMGLEADRKDHRIGLEVQCALRNRIQGFIARDQSGVEDEK